MDKTTQDNNTNDSSSEQQRNEDRHPNDAFGPPPPVMPTSPRRNTGFGEYTDQSENKHSDIQLVETIIKFTGPTLLTAGLIFGLSYAVREDYISSQMQLIGGLIVSLIVLFTGEWVKTRNQKTLGMLVSGAGLTGLFLTSYSVAPVYDTPPGVTIFLAGMVGAGSLILALRENNPMTFTFGIAGFLAFPSSLWFNMRDIDNNLETIESGLPVWQIVIPLVVFAAAGLVMRTLKGWTGPWMMTSLGLLAYILYANAADIYVSDVNDTYKLAAILVFIGTSWVGYLQENRPTSNSEPDVVFQLLDMGQHVMFLSVFAAGIPSLIAHLNLNDINQHVAYAIFGSMALAAAHLFNIPKIKQVAHHIASIMAFSYAITGFGYQYLLVMIAAVAAFAAYYIKDNKIESNLVTATHSLISAATVVWLLIVTAAGFESPGLLQTIESTMIALVTYGLISYSTLISERFKTMQWTVPALGFWVTVGVLGTSPVMLAVSSGVWALISLACVTAGITGKDSRAIWVGLIGFTITTSKIGLIDLAEANVLAKSATAVFVGIILVAISFNFDKLRAVLEPESSSTQPPTQSVFEKDEE